jgi:hypothetical protein
MEAAKAVAVVRHDRPHVSDRPVAANDIGLPLRRIAIRS